MLKQARELDVPTFVDPDATPFTSLEFALSAGITPDDWQQKVLDSNARKHLFLCCRQSGKSTTSALMAAEEACRNPGALVLMLAPSQRQSGELARKCFGILKTVTLPVPKIVSESALKCELSNGSRIIALPGSEATTRGYSAATLVVIDEASRVADELIAAVRPALATTNGRMVCLSTPNGKRGFFYLEWFGGGDWERTEVSATDCARISKEFLADEERILGPHVFQQEYFNMFYDPDTAVFSSDLIEQALTDSIKPLWEGAAWPS
jgi:hypothetical protein